MPMLLAPVVGQLAERWGGKPLVVTGLGLQAIGLAWLASVTDPDHARTPTWWCPFVVCGIGMTLFFVPLASLVLGAVPRSLEGVASGANAAFRELGGVLGIAVLGAIFSSHGGYASGQDYVNGHDAGRLVGAAVVAVGAVAALLRPRADGAARDRRDPVVPGGARRPGRHPEPPRGARAGRRRLRRPVRSARGIGRRARGSTAAGASARSVGCDEAGPGQCGPQDVGGLGPELGERPVAVDPDARGRPGRSVPTPKRRGHVDEQGQLHGVAVGQAALLEDPAGVRRSPRPAAVAIPPGGGRGGR